MPTSHPNESARRLTAIAVMARYPEIGRVKTRLARSLGAERATELYRAFLLDIESRFANGPRALVWFYEPPDAPFASILPAGAVCRPQYGSNLGERMREAFKMLLSDSADHRFERVIMIGADVPHVREDCIDEADDRLDDNDVVVGPSTDGGYYLIALRRPHDVFTMIEMGTPRVLQETRAAIEAGGLRLHLLPMDFDIDEVADLERLQREIEDGLRPPLPNTTTQLNACAI